MADQAPRLAASIPRAAAGRLPGEAPISLHVIGHSEGAVVAALALEALDRREPDSLPGYTKLTMLDPYSANNDLPGSHYSTTSGLLGHIADLAVRVFQARAKDPPSSCRKTRTAPRSSINTRRPARRTRPLGH